MRTRISSVLLAVAFPFLVFGFVAQAMTIVSGRKAALAGSHPPNPTPLNTRFSYDAAEAIVFWNALGRDGMIAEQRFLQFDLVFPTLYGGALAASLIWLCRRAGWSPLAALLPVVVGVVADWTENLVQLEQLRLHMTPGSAGVDSNAIRVASLATATKLIAVGAGFVLLFVLAAIILLRRPVT